MGDVRLLLDLARRNNAHKAGGFLEFYAAEFPDRHTVLRVLELGVYQGGSVKMWRDYFPNAVVHGADIVERDDTRRFYRDNRDPRIVLHRVDQGSDDQIRALVAKFEPGTFDVIIDDGSHFNRDQLRCMDLLHSLLRPETGVYVIEDLHTSTDPDREERGGRPRWQGPCMLNLLQTDPPSWGTVKIHRSPRRLAVGEKGVPYHVTAAIVRN